MKFNKLPNRRERKIMATKTVTKKTLPNRRERKIMATKTVTKKTKKKTKNSHIDLIMDQYEAMVMERAKIPYEVEDDDWKSDKKWIKDKIVEAGLLDQNDVKNIWRSFDYIMDNLAELDWGKQRELIVFLFNWVYCP